ncbi:MAG: peptidyl-prolyl cis-trans isomerase [Henriciella sp.]|nr:peptidyl-prolyl cis-trans isomerase [Henriciella sp.]
MAEPRRAIWREPLLHFLLAGAVIFAVNAWRGPDTSRQSDKIIVTVNQVARMAVLWEKTWGRTPTEAELQGLVRDRIKEEVYYREALKLGLDINDTVIRRRLRQKMEFLALTDLEMSAPDPAVLRDWFENNAERYAIGPSFWFEQIYFEGYDSARIEAVRQSLKTGMAGDDNGDPISLPAQMQSANQAEISRIFGQAFYNGLLDLPMDQWSGPITSGFGQHLVRITAIQAASAPSFEDRRAQVQRDWLAQARLSTEQEKYETLRDKYTIEIESPGE